jgi:low affinity Fe/Cu permease
MVQNFETRLIKRQKQIKAQRQVDFSADEDLNIMISESKKPNKTVNLEDEEEIGIEELSRYTNQSLKTVIECATSTANIKDAILALSKIEKPMPVHIKTVKLEP